jgi:hypothetical protein
MKHKGIIWVGTVPDADQELVSNDWRHDVDFESGISGCGFEEFSSRLAVTRSGALRPACSHLLVLTATRNPH